MNGKPGVLAVMKVAEPHYPPLRQARATVERLAEAAHEHMLAAIRVQAAKPGSHERDMAEQYLNGAAYLKLRAALAAFRGEQP